LMAFDQPQSCCQIGGPKRNLLKGLDAVHGMDWLDGVLKIQGRWHVVKVSCCPGSDSLWVGDG
jgi:hypothetical protein